MRHRIEGNIGRALTAFDASEVRLRRVGMARHGADAVALSMPQRCD